MEVNGLSEFLEAQGISWMQRKLAMNCNPVDTIKVDGQKLTISYTGIYKLIQWIRTIRGTLEPEINFKFNH